MARALRAGLPFRRIAVVLSGGGALAAYEVGVLKTLEVAGLRPHVVSGASAGALNAVAWVAQGFRTSALERVWRTINPGAIGIRWTTLAWRAAGAFLVAVGVLEMLLTWTSSPELGTAAVLWRAKAERAGFPSAVLDLAAWAALALAGVLVLRSARGAERWLARLGSPDVGRRVRAAVGVGLLVWALIHVVTWAFAIPWPHRFSATLLLAAFAVWLTNDPGRVGTWARSVFLRLLPEAQGRGLWGEAARRKLVARLVARGDPARLVADTPHLILVALALDTGRVAHFVNGAAPSPGFRASVEARLGEVIQLRSPPDVLAAAVASSAIPVIFEPALVKGREFVDAVAFATHPLRAAVDAGADAALVVRVAPGGATPSAAPRRHPLDVWERFLDLAGWRDLQQEIQSLPASWRGGAVPRPLCIVEPETPLPWGVLSYSPKVSKELIRRGEADAWRALDQAGWLAS
jgi:predicted acylesterase/phospholipase RssA